MAAAAALLAAGPETDQTSVSPTHSADELAAEAQFGDVTIPVDSREAILLGSSNTEVSLLLPTPASAEDAAAVGGDAVYVDDIVSTVVDVQDEGIRVMEVLNSSDAPTRYSYDLELPDGAQLIKTENGEVVIAEVSQTEDQVTANVSGTFSAPWAVDAAGAYVPVSYEVSGERITMIVQHGAAYQYPITADPTLTWGDFQIG